MTPQFRFTIISQPAGIQGTDLLELKEQCIELCRRATGGPRWRTFHEGREAWTKYYETVGTRVNDFDRLSLAFDGSTLVHMSAAHVIPAGAWTVVWLHTVMSDPDNQHVGLLAKAMEGMFAPAWVQTLSGRLALAIRTPNPVVYEAARKLAPRLFPSVRIYPDISPSGLAAIPPQEIQDLARSVAARLSPDCLFLINSFVIKGYYREYEGQFGDVDFPAGDAGVRGYFDRNVQRGERDGILILVAISRER